MILIISSNDDYSTSNVIDWLRHYRMRFVRVSSSFPIVIESIDPNNPENCSFWVKKKFYRLSDFSGVWYRRSGVILETYRLGDFPEVKMKESLNAQLKTESSILRYFFLKALKKKSLNSELDNDLNKLEELQVCRQLGIRTPESVVTSSKQELLRFFEANKGAVITKNFSQGIFIQTKKVGFISSTQVVTRELIDSLDDRFSPMYFQEMIPKAFEVRSFYLDGRFFSSAIFSQNDEMTKVDFRNYNREKPNRTPPFQIPQELEYKLDAFMRKMEINSGSIDLLVTPEGDFYFLEVNPIGQFYQVSKPCNYRLEKEIALYLMQLGHVD